MKKITFSLIFFQYLIFFHVDNCFAAYGWGSDMGIKAVETAAPIVERAAQGLSEGLKEVGLKTIQEAIPAIDRLQGTVVALSGKLEVVSDKLAIALQNAGVNAGVAVADKIGASFNASCVAVKTAGVSVKAAALAHPVITTVVVGTVVVVIIAYGTYKIYRYYHPKTTQVDEAKAKLEIAKAQAAMVKFKAVEEKKLTEDVFKKSLIQHASSTAKTVSGIPVACQKAAQDLAIVAGQKKVDKIVASFNKYSLQAA